MRFPSPLIRGMLVKKYRRFIVDVRLEDGSIVTAHCPTMGAMHGLTDPGRTVMLSDSGVEARRHRLTWELVNVGGVWVGINSTVPSRILLEAIETNAIPTLREFTDVQRRATYGRGNKIDIVLQGMEWNCFINTFHVTWVEDRTAFFPDAPSPRIVKSLRQLAEIARQGHRAVAFFFVQRADCSVFKPAEHVDREFLKALLLAQGSGVVIMAYRGHITPEEITLGDPLPYASE